jgi:hypothetical protein
MGATTGAHAKSMNRNRSLRRLRISTLVVCLLFFGIVGNWHVHAFKVHGADEPPRAAPAQDHPVGGGCPACSLGHHFSNELRPAISPVTEQVVGRSTPRIFAIPDSPEPDADPSRAPPVRL